MGCDKLLKRIFIDHQVCFSQPFIRRTRIQVPLVVNLLSAELSIEHILEEYLQI